MAPDYDLSNLPTDQADLWIYLQTDAICGQIMADQAERLGRLAQTPVLWCLQSRMDVLFPPGAVESVLSCASSFYHPNYSLDEFQSITTSNLAAWHFFSRLASGRMH
jgi:hypothetical protein